MPDSNLQTVLILFLKLTMACEINKYFKRERIRKLNMNNSGFTSNILECCHLALFAKYISNTETM